MSHAVPQMWGTLLFAVLMSAALVACDWRLALASLWVLPASVAVIVASRRSQDALSSKLVECRLDASDGILETIECAADIRACNRLEGVEERLNRLFEEQERMQGRYEFAASVAFTSARSLLQAGFATFLLAAAALLAAGMLSWQALLLFCLVVPRLYDPLVDALSNMLEVFAADTSNARLSEIENHPVAQGSPEFSPQGYDIVFDDVGFSYTQGSPVLEDVSFVARQGEVTALVGPSGSGKSTFLNLIGGLEDADGGSIMVDGCDLTALKPADLGEYRRRELGFVFQFYNLVPDLTIKENIEVTAHLSKNPLNIDDLLRSLGLYEHRNKFPRQVSGGQQQRCAIGRALVKNPGLLLCDEPTGALDYKTSKEILQLMEDVNRTYGCTIIIVTHNAAIARMANRVLRLRDGRIVEDELNESPVAAAELDW